MDSLEHRLREELLTKEALALRRFLPSSDAGGVDFTSNDYLGLSRDPRLVAAAIAATERGGAGGRASRLLGGGDEHHRRAERAAADWMETEAALLFPSGYQANLALLSTLAQRGDALVCDERNHASLIDAARLSRARVLVHRHGDLLDAERCLRLAAGARRRFLVTEGVFSMDGDRVDLAGLAELAERHAAWLLVDEAHSAGLLGPEGRGAFADSGARGQSAARLFARTITGGKALGAGGAFVVGSRALVDSLVQAARGFVFSTAPQPGLAGALEAAIAIVRGSDDARSRCLGAARAIAAALEAPAPAAAIVPWVLGDEALALEAASTLNHRGQDVRAVRPPTVPANTSRLRIVARAEHTRAQIETLCAHIADLRRGFAERGGTGAIGRKPPRGRALVVMGTDTGIGKTVSSALLVCALKQRGNVAYWKPVQTGDESDTQRVLELAGDPTLAPMAPRAHYLLPASPHEAAAAEGQRVPVDELLPQLEGFLRDHPAHRLVVELAGGLLVPYDDQVTQGDWLARFAPPLLLVARSGLGTLNHTLLTAEALAARGLWPFALLLVGPRHRSNRATLAQRLQLPVLELEHLEGLEQPGAMARATAGPLRDLARQLADLAIAATPLEQPT